MDNTVIKTTSRSSKDLTNLAYAVRKVLGMENTLYFPVVRFTELILPVLDDKFHFDIVPDGELPNMYAYTDPDKHCIVVRESVYNGAANNNPKDRMTIAHELGHYFMHDHENCIFAQRDPSNRLTVGENAEAQASIFAAVLLMPPWLIRRNRLDAIGIKKECRVTFAAAKNAYRHAEKEKAKRKSRATQKPGR